MATPGGARQTVLMLLASRSGLCAAVFLGACTPPPPAEPVDLVVPEGWRIAEGDEDPFPEHRTASKRACDPAGFQAEEGALEIESARCGYVTALQASAGPVAAEQELSLLLWHLTLVSVPGALAHVAVTIDGLSLFDATIPMPASAEVYDVRFVVPRAIPAGAEVAFHVHNHGANSYRFGHLRALPPLEP